MKSGVYRITCLINGKFYIGSAINIRKRWKEHKVELNKNIHGNKYLQRSWNKYGEEYFDWDIIEYCKIENLIKREQYYIDYMSPQYNICKIANSFLGVKWSEERKKKQSKRLLGNQRNLGKKHSKETCQKLSKLLIGNQHHHKRFSNEDIKWIREMKIPPKEKALEYGCSLSTIYDILKNRIYKDVKI